MFCLLLTQGKYTLVDNEDYDRVIQYKWRTCSSGNYVQTSLPRSKDGKRPSLLLHRFILGVDDRKIEVDHINGDGLDNTRSNLRKCSSSQNKCNRETKSKTGLKGVRIGKECKNRWFSEIQISGNRIYLGMSSSPEEAYAAYCKAAKEHHGEFARVEL